MTVIARLLLLLKTHNPMLAEAETIKHLSYVTEKMDKLREKAISDAVQRNK